MKLWMTCGIISGLKQWLVNVDENLFKIIYQVLGLVDVTVNRIPSVIRCKKWQKICKVKY